MTILCWQRPSVRCRSIIFKKYCEPSSSIKNVSSEKFEFSTFFQKKQKCVVSSRPTKCFLSAPPDKKNVTQSCDLPKLLHAQDCNKCAHASSSTSSSKYMFYDNTEEFVTSPLINLNSMPVFAKILIFHSILSLLFVIFHIVCVNFNISHYEFLFAENENYLNKLHEIQLSGGIYAWFVNNLNVSSKDFVAASLYPASILTSSLLFFTVLYMTYKKKLLKLILRRLYGLICMFIIFFNLSSFVFGGCDFKSIGFPDIYLAKFICFHPHFSNLLNALVFFTGFSIDLALFLISIYGCFKYSNKLDAILFFSTMASISIPYKLFLSGNLACNSADKHWVDFISHHQAGHIDSHGGISKRYNPIHLTNRIYMKDGIPIVIDLYFPQEFKSHLEEASNFGCFFDCENFATQNFTVPQLPVFVDITRYNRRTAVRWPFSMFRLWNEPSGASFNLWAWRFIQALVPNGYVVVVADTRGTGASLGHRQTDLSESEINDFVTIVQWVKSQWWSSKIGIGGLSYDGMAGLKAAANEAVDAAVSFFTPVDVLNDLVSPGGLISSAFLNDYYGLTRGFEIDGNPKLHIWKNLWLYPLHVMLGFTFIFKGPFNVPGVGSQTALDSHSANWDMRNSIKGLQFHSDSITLSDQSQSLHSLTINMNDMKGLAKNNVSVYIASGYYDGGLAKGGILLYNYLNKHASESKPQLVLGPWNHSGKRSYNLNRGTYSCSEPSLYHDVVRFLDCHVKDKCWGGIEDEASVHYWQVGDDQWQHAYKFPRPENQFWTFQLSITKGNTLFEKTSEKKKYYKGIIYRIGNYFNYLLEHINRHDTYLQHIIHDTNQYLWFFLHRLSTLWSQGFTSDLAASEFYLMHPVQLTEKLMPNRIFSNFNICPLIPENSVFLNHQVDYSSSTGPFSRWAIARHVFSSNVIHGNRLHPLRHNSKHSKLTPGPLIFQTNSLKHTIRVVGQAHLHLRLLVKDCTDVPIFAYLEDFDVDNNYSHYVTEAKVMATHRVSLPGSKRSFTPESYLPIQDEEFIEIPIDFEPVAWSFAAGHSIRLTLYGSDAGNFELPLKRSTVLPDSWSILLSNNMSETAFVSRLDLPLHV